MKSNPKVGDRIVYSRQKYSESPGPRAKNVAPSAHGELYSYEVDKYWVVELISNGTMTCVTRKGKRHTIKISDPLARPATWWETFFLANRFPTLDTNLSPAAKRSVA